MNSKVIVRGIKHFSVFLILTVIGCMTAVQLLKEQRGLSTLFSHKLHIEDQGLACESCHKTDGDKASMPDFKKCLTCHEGTDEDKPAEKKVTVYLKDGKPQWSDFTKLPEDIKFSHKTHIGKSVSCDDCHKDVKANEAVSSSLKLSMDTCLECHAQKGKPINDCLTCHKTINKDKMPKTHEKNWKRLHGQVAKEGVSGSNINNCKLCHTESACVKCHQDEPPINHNNFWRLRSHGLTASIDRDNCATCHRTDFCQRCHEETSPQNHIAGWGTPQDRHCLTCHLPLKANNCNVCHRSAGHETAPTAPGWHLPTDNCRACHLVMPHIDNGDNCASCHF